MSRPIWEIKATATEATVTDDGTLASVAFATDLDCDYSFHLTREQLASLKLQIEQALSDEAP